MCSSNIAILRRVPYFLSPWTGATLIRVNIKRSVRLVVLVCLVYGRQSAFRVPAGFFLYSSYVSLGGTHTMQAAAATFGILLSRSRPGGNMNPQYPGSKGSSLRFFVSPKLSQAITGMKKFSQNSSCAIFWF
jgi:hypothetical protein